MKVIEKIINKGNDMMNAPPVTIVLLGDSVTQGCFECYFHPDGRLDTVFEPEHAYASKLKTILRTMFPSAQINMINSGISGDNAPHGNERFRRDVQAYSPDLVVVAFGLNDCCGGLDALPYYTDALQSIFEKTKALGAECILLTPNMMNQEVSEDLSDERFRNLAADLMTKPLEEYVNAAVALAKENEVAVCDVYAKWKAMAQSGICITNLLSNRLNHPIRELHWLTAQALVETMIKE